MTMITRPKTRLMPTDPSVFWCVVLVTTAPHPANTSANAASPSAAARRRSAGRSGIDRLDRHADDRQPPRQALQRESAHVLLADAEQLLRRSVPGWLERLGDGRQEVAQGRAHDIGLVRMVSDRRAQEPHPVADVARFVVVDLRVPVDEASEQLVLAEELGDEAE